MISAFRSAQMLQADAGSGSNCADETTIGARIGCREVSGYRREKALLGELHLIRRRLEGALGSIAYVVRTAEEDGPWRRVEEATRLASRAIAAAVSAAPPLPPDDLRPRELEIGALRIDTLSRRQWWADEEFRLTSLRHSLLVMLAAEPYRVFGKDELR